MFSRLYSIAANTFTETIRQPIYGAMLIVTALMMIANVGLAGFTLSDDDKLLRDLGLSTLLLSGLFLAAFSATGVLTREIDNKTVLTVISKPVGRPVFILGKYVGLMTALLLAFYISFLAFAMSLRHKVLQTSAMPWDMPIIVLGFGGAALSLLLAALLNYYNGSEFIGTSLAIVTPTLTICLFIAAFFDPKWTPQPFEKGFISGQIILASFLVLMAIMILAAVALAASTRLGQVMTLTVCVVVLIIGLIADYMFSPYADKSPIIGLLYRVYPNLNVFWVIDAVNNNVVVPLHYIGRVCLYALCQILAILLIGMALFQKREVG